MTMGYDFDHNDARMIERRLAQPRNRLALNRQNRLMIDMLKPMRGQSILDIGCGTGVRLMPLLELGLDVTAVDLSKHMIQAAAQKPDPASSFVRLQPRICPLKTMLSIFRAW